MKEKNKIVQLKPEERQWAADQILQKIYFSEIEKFQILSRSEG